MSAPIATAGDMLARDWALEVDTSTTPGTPEWVRVYGLKSCSYVTEGSEQDATVIEDGGYASPIITGLSAKIEASGFRRGGLDGSTYKMDPGQAFLAAKGLVAGVANFARVRVYRTDDSPEAHEMTAIVKWVDSAASDPNALREFSVTLASRGKPITITKPVTGP